MRVVGRLVDETRARLALGRAWAERTVLARRARPGPAGRRTRILAYHAVGLRSWGINNTSARRLRRQLELARAEGYRFVAAADVVHGAAPATDCLAVTFDDGLRCVAESAAPVLAELDVPWTMFVVTSWADGSNAATAKVAMRWDELGALVSPSVTIGSHSVTHPDFGVLTGPPVQEEIESSRQRIRARLGVECTSFAIPFGQSGNWTAEAHAAAVAAGYREVYAQSEDRRPAGTAPRTMVAGLDGDRLFLAALAGAFDQWEEWS